MRCWIFDFRLRILDFGLHIVGGGSRFAICHLLFAATQKGKAMTTKSSQFEPTWTSLKQYQIPDWYQDEKFGIFIHWGPYCVPAFGN